MNTNQSAHLKLGSLFDGIGGFVYPAKFFGIEPVWASEIMPTAISVTKRHFPDMVHLGDITKLNGGEIPPVDIIVFGSPCQSWSIAGNRTGFAGKSGLFTEAIRIINEMRKKTNGTKPKYAIFENVPGLLYGQPYNFRTVLEAFVGAEIPLPRHGKWTNAGMVRSGRCDIAWTVYDSSQFNLAQRRHRIYLVADYRASRRNPAEILFEPKSLCGYFAASGAAGENTPADTFGDIDQSGKSVGNTDVFSIHQSGDGMVKTSETAYTIIASSGSSTSRNAALCLHPKVTGTLLASGAGTAHVGGMAGETDMCVVSAVNCRSFREIGDISGTIQASESLNAINPIRVPNNQNSYAVRRLLPVECEKLMVFPVGWTAYGHDGKHISDSKRYMMLGNSVCTPCVAHIYAGIAEQFAKDGDIFD